MKTRTSYSAAPKLGEPVSCKASSLLISTILVAGSTSTLPDFVTEFGEQEEANHSLVAFFLEAFNKGCWPPGARWWRIHLGGDEVWSFRKGVEIPH